MNILINSNNHKDVFFQFTSKSKVDLFCPFINTEIIGLIIESDAIINRIIVRWHPEDFATGYASLDLYKLTKENNIDLYFNHRIHLKATLRSDREVFHSSANLTQAGMNINVGNNFNYELSSIINASNNNLIYFEKIVQDSVFVNDQVFEKLEEMIDEQGNYMVNEPFEMDFEKQKKLYISQLPQTHTIEDLYHFYTNQKKFNRELELCIIHDLAIFSVQEGLNENQFLVQLSTSFFNHPFIKLLINEVEKEGFIYFGRVKEWIQNNCLDTPVPKRRELTEVVQILYKWIEILGEGKYVIEQPNHSQRIRVIE